MEKVLECTHEGLNNKNCNVGSENYDIIKKSWENILTALHGDKWKSDENYKDTPDRIAKSMITERCQSLTVTDLDIKDVLSRTFPTKFNGFIIIGPITVHGLCPHHFENVNYKVVIGYVPKKERGVVGLSKPGRLSKLLGRGPILHEDLCNSIADTFYRTVEPEGVGVLVSGVHNCMCARGLSEPESSVLMVELRGTFLENPSVKSEFYELLKLKRIKF